MKLTLTGAILSLVGLAVWLIPLYRMEHTNWTPLSVPVSLASNFDLKTNCNANTPGLYFVRLAFEAARFDLKDDTPEDDTKYPRRIAAEVQLRVVGRQGTLVDTSVTNPKLGSHGGGTVKYTLEAFDLKEPGQIAITFSNTPSRDFGAKVNPRLEIELSSALLEGQLMTFYLRKRLGIVVALFGLVLLIAGLFLRSRGGGELNRV